MESSSEQDHKKVKKVASQISDNSPIEADVNELAPDLNGEKQTELAASPTPMDVNTDVKDDNEVQKITKLDARVQGRKRKASEIKTEDVPADNTLEVPETTQTLAQTVTKPDDVTEDLAADASVSSKQTDTDTPIRKGKRARIPNKRYDVTITSGGFPGFPKQAEGNNKNAMDKIAHFQKDVENGDANVNSAEVTSSGDIQNVPQDEQTPNKEQIGSEITSSSIPSRLSQRSSFGGTPGPLSRKQKLSVDLTDPIYLKPFEYGWKRELVYRATLDSNFKKNGDIYYYTPSGKKVRSMREVSENLKEKALTLDNFTFFKEPLGIGDPEKEVIRDAKVKGPTVPSSAKKVAIPKPKTPKTPKTPKEKILSPKPPSVGSPKSGGISPKATKSPSLGGFKVKLPGRGPPSSGGKAKSQKKSKNNVENDEVVSGMLPPNYTSPPKKTPARTSARPGEDGKPCQPCSIRCLGVAGLIPNLQCRLCLCLYHNECVGLSPLETNTGGYVCKNCQLVNQDPSTSLSDAIPSIAPSPLIPHGALKTHNTQSLIPQKLQRIPRLGELTNGGDPSKIGRPIKYTANNNYSENKSLVGSVTTWFPPSSTIQVGNAPQSKSNENNIISTPRPQHVEYLGDRKFLIIPKHNVLSFSPTIATAASTPVTRPIIRSDKPPDDSNLAAAVPDVDSATCPNSVQLNEVPPSAPSESQLPPKDPFPEPPSDKALETDQTAATPDIAETPMDVDVGASETLEAPKPSPKAKKSFAKQALMTANSEKSDEGKFMDNYLQNLAFGWNTLLYVFQHLKVQDLLRAGCVCTMWRDIARHSLLWKTVRMKNSQIYNFEGLADALEKYGTVNLDLRKMLLPTSNTNSGGAGADEKIWPPFSKAIERATSLRRIELCRCPANVIENLAVSNPLLEVINAVTIKCDTMSLSSFVNLKNLQELRLKSTAGFSLTSDLSSLKELNHLKILSLTSIKDLHKVNIEVIGDLENLESLDLGECTDFPEIFGTEILSKLNKLEKLRLEKGQGSCCTFEILAAVKNIPRLELLELVNFDIKTGFDKALGACTNIKKLLIIPTYISQSATTNHMVLGGVLRLQSTLSQFVWGVTLELLRVTELFVDQCDQDSDKKEKKKEKKPTGKGDSIPVLKPVPLLSVGSSEISPAEDPPQVEILPLPTLQKLLLQSLPTTRVKILKIPFHATWRQSIVDTVN